MPDGPFLLAVGTVTDVRTIRNGHSPAERIAKRAPRGRSAPRLADGGSLAAVQKHGLPLLRAEEELELGRRIAAGHEAADRLRSCAGTEDDSLIAIDADAARHILVMSNLRLVLKVVNAYSTSHLSKDDLFQEGLIGLDRATRTFDWRRGFKFSTYAFPWIKKSLAEAVEKQEHLIRLSTHATDVRNRVRAARQLHQTDTQIAAAAGVSPGLVQSLSDWERGVDSLDRSLSPGGPTLAEVVGDIDARVEAIVDRLYLETLLRTLNAEERLALLHHFGICDDARPALAMPDEVGDIAARALAKVRRAIDQQDAA